MKKILMFSILVFSFLIPSFVYAFDSDDNHTISVCSTGDCDYSTLEEALTFLDTAQPEYLVEYNDGVPVTNTIIIEDTQKQIIGNHTLLFPLFIQCDVGSSLVSIEGENNSIITTDYPISIIGVKVSLDSITIHTSNHLTEVKGSALSLKVENAILNNFYLIGKRELVCGNKTFGLTVFGNLSMDDSVVDGFDVAVSSQSIILDNLFANYINDTGNGFGTVSGSGFGLSASDIVINSSNLSNNTFSLTGVANYTVSRTNLNSCMISEASHLNLKGDNSLNDLKVKQVDISEFMNGEHNFCSSKGIFYAGEVPSVEITKDLVVDINKTKKIQNMIEYFREDASNAIDFDYDIIYGEDSDVTKEYVKVTDGSINILQSGMVTIKATRGDGVNEPIETYFLNLNIVKAFDNPGTGTVLLIGFVILLVVSLVVITILTKRKKK